MREDSFMPDNYKFKAKEDNKYLDHKPTNLQDSVDSKKKHKRAPSATSKTSKTSKYSYDKQKKVGQKIDNIHKGTDLEKPKKPNR
jgi:hypothetical protein